jgi:uncharacterized protein YneF (UPF0154 family)
MKLDNNKVLEIIVAIILGSTVGLFIALTIRLVQEDMSINDIFKSSYNTRP